MLWYSFQKATHAPAEAARLRAELEEAIAAMNANVARLQGELDEAREAVRQKDREVPWSLRSDMR